MQLPHALVGTTDPACRLSTIQTRQPNESKITNRVRKSLSCFFSVFFVVTENSNIVLTELL